MALHEIAVPAGQILKLGIRLALLSVGEFVHLTRVHINVEAMDPIQPLNKTADIGVAQQRKVQRGPVRRKGTAIDVLPLGKKRTCPSPSSKTVDPDTVRTLQIHGLFLGRDAKPNFDAILEGLSIEICFDLNHLCWAILPSVELIG